jgi:glycosyltransferase involved in cell wall biosynthesis
MKQNVLFITTKQLDYIRNNQEIQLIQKEAGSVTVIGSDSRSYPARLLKVFWSVLTCRVRNYETVFIGFAPQLVLPFFLWKLKSNHIVIDFFISMYDTFVMDRQRFPKNSIPAKLLHFFDTFTVKHADEIIVDTKAHGDYFVREFHAAAEKIHVLYLEADKNIYYPRNAAKPQQLAGKYVVLYFGSILPLQGVDTILDAIGLCQSQPNIFFIVIGPVPEQKKQGLQNAEFIDYLPQVRLAEEIAKADLCLAGHFNSTIEKASRTIPGKAYIYESMEKEMILGENPANHEIFTEDERHHFVNMGDAEALADKIKSLYLMQTR